MNELLNRILDLPRQQKIGILAGFIVLVAALYIYFFYLPAAAEITKLSQEIESSQKERDTKKKEVANLPKIVEQAKQLDGMLKEAVAQLPDKKEIPELLSNISTKARESGLDVLVFRPKGENLKDFYAEVPLDLVVRGGFHNVVTFFDEVGRLSRLVNMSNIELKNAKAKDDQVIMEAATLATTFRFLDEAERAKIAAEKAAKEAREKAKAGK